jgi:hypothetical protein
MGKERWSWEKLGYLTVSPDTCLFQPSPLTEASLGGERDPLLVGLLVGLPVGLLAAVTARCWRAVSVVERCGALASGDK